jgi:hypothetical protein
VKQPKKTSPKLAPPPAHLKDVERGMWSALVAEHSFDDVASLALLRTALEAHQRSRQCREAIDKDGATFKDRFQQIRVHPLMAAERDARAAFLQAVKALNLDLTGGDDR